MDASTFNNSVPYMAKIDNLIYNSVVSGEVYFSYQFLSNLTIKAYSTNTEMAWNIILTSTFPLTVSIWFRTVTQKMGVLLIKGHTDRLAPLQEYTYEAT